jgi:hypothetical protein
MKKILFLILIMGTAMAVSAQFNPLQNLPHEKGQTIINKCYDGDGNLRATMRYEIADYNESEHTGDLKINFTMTDAAGEVIDHGTLDAYYDGENVELRMSNRPEIEGIDGYLSMNTKLTNDFLDYPDEMDGDALTLVPGPFKFWPADYTIKVGERARDFVRVEVSKREYVGDERITTPAGTFDARKVTFDLEIYNHDTRQRDNYRGTEWYAPGEGIVRTEITDRNGNMVDYSEIVDIYTRR